VTDEQIIELYWQRNENAIQATNSQYGAYCYAISNNILHNHESSEECVNDTWLRAWNAIPPQRPDRLKIFLAKIARNLSFDRYKSLTAEKRGRGETVAVLDELEECVVASTDVEAEIQAKELAQLINDFLNVLCDKERNIFLRRYFYVDSTADIAKLYGLKESNVLMTLSRTRQRLKIYLMQEGYLEQ